MATDAETVVLEALAAQGEILQSRAGTCNPPFRSRLRLVDRERSLLLVDRSPDLAANAALLAASRADLQFEWGEWRVSFAAGNPVPFVHEGVEVIRLDIPGSVAINRRRMYRRQPDPLPPLKCLVRVGDIVLFAAVVTDVSQGGIGIETGFAAALEPGMVLEGAQLLREGREPVSVDLEVRHTSTVKLPGGGQVVRAGCWFANLSPAAMGVIAPYVGSEPASG